MPALPTLIYDGHCHFCRSQAERLARWMEGQVRLESFHEPGVLERYGLGREVCEQALQLILPNGSMYAGAAAVAEILKRNPRWAWLGLIYDLPGMRTLIDVGYRGIARRRFRFSRRCHDDTCAHG